MNRRVAVVGIVMSLGAVLLPSVATATTTHYSQTRLPASSKLPSSNAGSSVAISGNTLVVGAPETVTAPGGGQGAVYVYTKPAKRTWSKAKLTAILTVAGSPPGEGEPGLGNSVAIAGNTIVAGDPIGVGADFTTAVYVFNKPAAGWRSTSHPTAKLTVNNSDFEIGYSVAIAGNTIASSALSGVFGDIQRAAEIWVKPASGWTSTHQTAHLLGGITANPPEGGTTVALSADTAVLGEPDTSTAVVFSRPGSGWANSSNASTLVDSNVAHLSADRFGAALAVNGSTVLVGAPGDYFTGHGTIKGAVYVYQKPAAGWSVAPVAHAGTIVAPSEQVGEGFGSALSMTASEAAVGASYRKDGTALAEGAAYVVKKPASGWPHAASVARLTETGGHVADFFGSSVGISGTTVAVGAVGYGRWEGAGYAFRPR